MFIKDKHPEFTVSDVCTPESMQWMIYLDNVLEKALSV